MAEPDADESSPIPLFEFGLVGQVPIPALAALAAVFWVILGDLANGRGRPGYFLLGLWRPNQWV
jgi:hypothetical protein